MSDGVGLVTTTHEPPLGAAASQQRTKVISINEDPAPHRQIDHLLWCVGGVELLLNFGVALYLMAEVIQSVQQGLCVAVHASSAGAHNATKAAGSTT
jgi:hypothetical protein